MYHVSCSHVMTIGFNIFIEVFYMQCHTAEGCFKNHQYENEYSGLASILLGCLHCCYDFKYNKCVTLTQINICYVVTCTMININEN